MILQIVEQNKKAGETRAKGLLENTAATSDEDSSKEGQGEAALAAIPTIP